MVVFMPNDAKPDVSAESVQSQVFAVPYPITSALIVVTAFASFVADRFRRDFAPFGAGFGTKTLGGEWWRLLTANFVHKSLFHLLGNLFFLWFFGKRMERILGKWTFLLFYLSCGVACRIVSIAARPEAAG